MNLIAKEDNESIANANPTLVVDDVQFVEDNNLGN